MNKELYINDTKVYGTEFAYDDCHKIYVIEDEEDKKESLQYGYKIYPISDIEEAFKNSCPLRLISNWKLNKRYVEQFKDAHFKWI